MGIDVKQMACDKLLELRVESKIKKKKAKEAEEKLKQTTTTTTSTTEGDEMEETTKDNEADKELMDSDTEDMEKDFEEERDDFPWPDDPDPNWDPTKFSIDWRKDYLLADESWKFHTIPEIMDGKNIADFVDQDILEKLDALEKEEEERLALEKSL